MTEASTSVTYLIIDSIDSVQLGFLILALNGVDIMFYYLENEYLNTPCCEKMWFEGDKDCEKG